MKRIILVYGLILGSIITINMLVMVNLVYHQGVRGNDFIGYAALILVFSLIYFAIRQYRNKIMGGQITFWQGFKVGISIAFIAATMYVVVWLFYYYIFIPDFLEVYVPHVLEAAADKGATEAELAEKAQEMANFSRMYQNPVFVIFTTYMEMFPIGVVVTLISAAILRKKAA